MINMTIRYAENRTILLDNLLFLINNTGRKENSIIQ